MTAGSVLDALVEALTRAAEYDPNAEERPAAVLWPDESSQWEPVINRVKDFVPLLVLGDYESLEWRGPAYWVRCIVDGTLPGPWSGTPVVYLPGHGRSDIRAVGEAPDVLKPLTELQYRGTTFAQSNGRDWTIAAFLQADPRRGGLGISVASDEATKAALMRARERLVNHQIEDLRRAAPLKAAFFDALLTPDIDRQVLQWLNDPVAFRGSLTADEWDAFRERFFDRFGLKLEAGEIRAAEGLGRRETDAWQQVWRTYADAPRRYPRVEELLRSARPKKTKEGPGLWDASGSWPQENEEAEDALRTSLLEVASLDAEAARGRLAELDQIHAERRFWVWAELGKAPIAFAIGELATLGRETRRNVPEGGLPDILDDYTDRGWTADDAYMRALAEVQAIPDRDAVASAGAAAYRPWLEIGAERMVRAVTDAPGDYKVEPLSDWPAGTCVIFTDGLRYDVGRRVAGALERDGFEVHVEARLAALPTVTPTAKPAVSPVADRLMPGDGFEVRAQGAKADLTARGLRRIVADAGFQVLEGDEGDPAGFGWVEQGDIDALGHEHEARLPDLLDSEVDKLVFRIRSLLDAGWKQVVVVTDHGWLYMPGGLPKAALPQHLTLVRKGRAARLAEGVKVDVPTVPWYWDPGVRIAIAPGIRVFSGNPVYEHGGVSPQECITPVVVATRRASPPLVGITLAMEWAGLRARIQATGAPANAHVDLRTVPGDAGTSLVGGVRELPIDGRIALLVEDEDREGTDAILVVLDADGRLLAQEGVIVGGYA